MSTGKHGQFYYKGQWRGDKKEEVKPTTEHCKKCSSPMVECALFNSTYMRCYTCEPKASEPEEEQAPKAGSLASLDKAIADTTDAMCNPLTRVPNTPPTPGQGWYHIPYRYNPPTSPPAPTPLFKPGYTYDPRAGSMRFYADLDHDVDAWPVCGLTFSNGMTLVPHKAAKGCGHDYPWECERRGGQVYLYCAGCGVGGFVP